MKHDRAVSKSTRATRSLESLERRLLLDAATELVADVNTTPIEDQEHAWLGDSVYFAADDGAGDVELWKSDGTSQGTMRVKDIRVGAEGSFPKSIVATNDRVYFSAYDDANGRELWATDGTVEGTRLVHDLSPGPADGVDVDAALGVFQNKVVFTARNEDNEAVFRVTHENADGTLPLKMLSARYLSFDLPTTYVARSGRLYFRSRADNSHTLWESDGTSDGTRELVSKSVSGTGEMIVTLVDNALYYTTPWGSRTDLWRYDLTTNTETLVHRGDRVEMTAAGGLLYFSQDEGLWRTDGTAEGTFQLTSDRQPDRLTAVGNELFFRGQSGQLWQTDGTIAGTNNQPGVAEVSHLREASGSLYLATNSLSLGRELAKVDGETVTRIDVVPGTDGSAPSVIAGRDGRAIFWTGAASGLWSTDGTQTGTTQINSSLGGPSAGSQPRFFSEVNGKSVFAADGMLLTIDATNRIQWLANVEMSSSERPVRVNDRIAFLGAGAEPLQNGLVSTVWFTDGTPEGTAPITGLDEHLLTTLGIANLTVLDDTLYFAFIGNVFRVDSSSLEAVPLSNTKGGLREGGLSAVNGALYFLIEQDDSIALWTSDGTPEGTNQLVEMPSSSGGTLYPTENQLFVVADAVGGEPSKIWRTDGTADGTRLLMENETRTFGRAAIFGERLIFVNSKSSSEHAIWATDGTTAGTAPIADGFATWMLASTQGVYFLADGLWLTDGTTEGTSQISSVRFGDYFDPDSIATTADGALYFSGYTGSTSTTELWRSDGTIEGTLPISDINPGEAAATPKYMANAAGAVYFAADDGFHGTELYRVPISFQPRRVTGDSNGDGVFNSSDLIQIFQRGEYEDGRYRNSVFEDGDWNGDGEFDTGDLVYAFQQGSYVETALQIALAAD